MKNDWKTIFPPQHWTHAAAANLTDLISACIQFHLAPTD
jgi:hypothetical protein